MNMETVPAAYIDIPFTVESSHAGLRLDRYLCLKLRGLSRTRVQRIIARQLVATRRLKPSTLVTAGLSFALRRVATVEPSTPTALPELYHDDDLLVVDKPAGLPVHPTARYQTGTVVGRLQELYGHAYAAPAHRLDRETSGVLVCTRTLAASRRLQAAFRAGTVAKEYLAVCAGWPGRDTFTIDAPLALGRPTVRIAMRVDAGGRPSRTRFRVEYRLGNEATPLSLLRAFPETGRQHQIRVHLEHAGLPIIGDKIYGGDDGIYDRFTKKALTCVDWARLRLPRQALHAARLSLTHPRTGAVLTFTAELPDDLRAFLLNHQRTTRLPGAAGMREWAGLDRSCPG